VRALATSLSAVADPNRYRPKPGEIPEEPGVYRFRDERGRVVYVGKAKSLRQRLNQYFADYTALHPRTQLMVTTAASVEWTVVNTEVEALQLEYSWIKEFDPRFNVKYRDDKSYPYLAVTMGEDFPRVMVMRGAKRKGTRYFGPYSHAWAIRETVDTLLRVFPVRTCSTGVFKRAGQIGRPCLLGYIGKCSAPCVKKISKEEHRELAEDFCDFMSGQTSRFIRKLTADMKQASDSEEYERAARLRDDIRALERALEKQAVVLGDGTDCDVIALAEDPLEAAVQIFYVRGGRIRGQRGWVLEKVEETTTATLVEHFLGQFYGEGTVADNTGPDSNGIPREVLVPELPPDTEAMTLWLSERRGGPVHLRVPQRGDKKTLAETVARNAKEALALHKLRRASDLTTRSKALHEIQDALELDDAPLRIECYDVSNLQGTHVVASMVVFEDGLARKSEYRRFSIKGYDGTDDVSAIREVITRRFRRYLEEREESGELDTLGDTVVSRGDAPPYPPAALPRGTGRGIAPATDGSVSRGDDPPYPPAALPRGTGRGIAPATDGSVSRGDDPPYPPAALPRGTGPGIAPATGDRPGADDLPAGAHEDQDQSERLVVSPQKKFAYPPNLVVVDGGAPQVAAAAAALAGLGIDDVSVCGLAKRLEEVWLPGQDYPVIMSRSSEGLYLLQRVRDEAHRFAITYHRAKRGKAAVTSALDSVPGLGPARRAALLKAFGSVKVLSAATPDEIAAAVPGIGQKLAETVVAALHQASSGGKGQVTGGSDQ
jgi:excinuclease ABC subunit C